ncbi:hypothetical protein [Desulfobacter vibrioformis]|nr:hypothetical protein [Desulfobacter vibrioformis]
MAHIFPDYDPQLPLVLRSGLVFLENVGSDPGNGEGYINWGF